MLKMDTSLHFAGDCEAAFKLYERCLGAKIVYLLKWGEVPAAAEVSAEWHDKVFYGRITIGGHDLVGGDQPPKQYQRPQGCSLVLSIDNVADGERIFNELAQGGEVAVPLRQTFWSPRYGMVVDRFGIAWEINCEQPT
jgi:PhnB protein